MIYLTKGRDLYVLPRMQESAYRTSIEVQHVWLTPLSAVANRCNGFDLDFNVPWQSGHFDG
jgi:hypothetical protein